jgi:hypothetical protein
MLALLRSLGWSTVAGALVAGTTALLAVGCSSAEGFSGPSSAYDGGLDGASDSAVSDGGAPRAPNLVVVHASPELWAFRVCLADSATRSGTELPRSIAPWPSDPSHPAPMSNFPAVALGTGALWSDITVPTKSYVIPYLVDALQLANSPTQDDKPCDMLACTGGSCLENSAWVALDAIDAETFTSSRAMLLAITGCPKATGSVAECGPTYDPSTGNLAATWTPLTDVSTSDTTAVQLAQLSLNFGAATVTSAYAGDASLASALPYGNVATSALLPVPLPSDPSAYATDTLTATGDAGALTLSLADIARLTDPSLLPSTLFAPSSNILIGIVGDPSATVAQIDAGGGAPYDGHGLHMIAVPMNPASGTTF